MGGLSLGKLLQFFFYINMDSTIQNLKTTLNPSMKLKLKNCVNETIKKMTINK